MTFPPLRRRAGEFDFVSVPRTLLMAVVAIGTAVAPLVSCAARAREPDQNSQKLILGFEKEELLRTEWTSREESRGRLGSTCWTGRRDSTSPRG